MTRAAHNIDIRALSEESAALLDAHLRRHFAESGRNGFHFVPFDLQTDSGPGGVNLENCFIPVGAPQWQRWFLAHDRASGDVLGHVDLKAYSLKTSAHRCLLGIGLEERARGQGVGRQLMQTAIDFVRAQPTLVWLDLMVFGHNTRARRLYESLGFVQTGVKTDCFRIGDTSIDDIYMSLRLRP
ncbi:MAG: GNAT family N-acetyltransferase [Pseudomonadales bacterium]|nr:GNAT family N-acetyltransferase [Pseudomonadales bacterium]